MDSSKDCRSTPARIASRTTSATGPSDDRRLLSLHEVARALGVHFYQARELVEAGEIRGIKVGRGGERQHWRISPAALDAWHRRQGEVA